MSKERMFPIQRACPVPWSAGERAWNTYARLCGTSQSVERIAERGGFGLNEFACYFLGHDVCGCGHQQECVEKADSCGRHLAYVEAEVVHLQGALNAMTDRAKEAERKNEQLKELLDPFVFLAREHCTGLYTPLDDWSVKVEIKAGALKRLIE